MALVLFSVFCETRAEFKKVATTGYSFLEISVSPRMSGMGEILTPWHHAGAEALFGNPGQLGFLETDHAFYLGYAPYLADTRLQTIGYAYHNELLGVFGLSFNQLDMGEMTHTVNADPSNPGGSYQVLGKYSANALAVGLTYARRLINTFSFGVNIKYVREQISDYASDNFVFDVGMLYFTEFGSMRLGGYIQNFGVDATYLSESFKMPMLFRLGVAGEVLGDFESNHRLTLAVEAIHPSNYTERVHIGAEYAFQNIVMLRSGYKFNYDEGGFTAGLGLQWPSEGYKTRVDISYTDFGLLGSVLRFGLNATF